MENTEKMKNELVDALRLATTELKEEYLKQIKMWSGEEFDRLVKMQKEYKDHKKQIENIWRKDRFGEWTEEWISLPSWTGFAYGKGHYGIEDDKIEMNPRLAREIMKKEGVIYGLTWEGVEKYSTKMVENAKNHYESSLYKLANRIIAKGLDISKMTMKEGFVDRNLEIEMTDGEKSVRAWTIIACGEIVKPHYRYLVK